MASLAVYYVGRKTLTKFGRFMCMYVEVWYSAGSINISLYNSGMTNAGSFAVMIFWSRNSESK